MNAVIRRLSSGASGRAMGLGIAILAMLLAGADWPQFRGPNSNSVAPSEQLPLEWSETQNTAWKVELPGRGPSSPIVVGNRVVVTCSSGINQDRLHVLCFDAANGQKLWERQFWATGRTLTHPTSANAAPTPASDGKLIFAFYSCNDLICLDTEGNLKWLRGLAYDFPRAGNDVGMAASPVVIGQTVVVQIESQGDSFATGIDTQTGETRWRVDRAPQPNWSSPIVMRGQTPGTDTVILQSPLMDTAHDPISGKQRWALKRSCVTVASPASDSGVAFLCSHGITAVRPTETHSEPTILWEKPKVQPSSASPLVHAGRLYVVNSSGVLACADTTTGKLLWRLRLGGSFWGTPVLAGDRLYCINQEGIASVVQISADEKPGKVVGTSQFGEAILCSPAVANGALYVRSERHLWKIASR